MRSQRGFLVWLPPVPDSGATAVSPMRVALGGGDGALRGFDYRPKEVLVGYSSIDGMGVGGALASPRPLAGSPYLNRTCF